MSSPEQFLSLLVPYAVNSLSDHYPVLKQKEPEIMKVIGEEERRFSELLVQGQDLIHKTALYLKKNEKEFPIKTAILLHKHHGYPEDLLIKAVEENNLTLDIEKLHSHQLEQERMKAKGREAMKETPRRALVTPVTVNDLLKNNIPYSNEENKYDCVRNQDGTYAFSTVRSKVLAVITKNGIVKFDNVVASKDGENVAVVLSETIFSAEKHGISSDIGVISFREKEKFNVNSVTYAGGFVFHHGRLKDFGITIGDEVDLHVNAEYRLGLMRARTALNILWDILRDVLENIADLGTRAGSDRIRLDMSGTTPTLRQLRIIMEKMQLKIMKNQPIEPKSSITTNSHSRSGEYVCVEKPHSTKHIDEGYLMTCSN